MTVEKPLSTLCRVYDRDERCLLEYTIVVTQ